MRCVGSGACVACCVAGGAVRSGRRFAARSRWRLCGAVRRWRQVCGVLRSRRRSCSAVRSGWRLCGVLRSGRRFAKLVTPVLLVAGTACVLWLAVRSAHLLVDTVAALVRRSRQYVVSSTICALFYQPCHRWCVMALNPCVVCSSLGTVSLSSQLVPRHRLASNPWP